MGSTALIVEILIIGAQTLIWLVLLTLICLGSSDTTSIQQLAVSAGEVGGAFSFGATPLLIQLVWS